MKVEIPEDIDPSRLKVAAHELGHMVAWQAAGFPIAEVAVRGSGRSLEGWCDFGRQTITTVQQGRGYLVGLLAGRVAEARWCRLTATRFDSTGSRDDLRKYRRYRRTAPLVRHIPHRELVGEARALVRGNWRRIARLTPKLARKGHLNG